MKPAKNVMIFSNVIDTYVYRNLISSFGKNSDLTCIFIGGETKPLFEFTNSINVKCFLFNSVRLSNVHITLGKLIWRMFKIHPTTILTFGQTASLIGLAAGFFSTSGRRIYLRCHTSLHVVEKYPRGIFYDRLCNFLAHKIVVPNKTTYNYLIWNEGVKSKKLEVIEFGIDLEDFARPGSLRIENMRSNLEIDDTQFVIGIASRYSKFKGLEFSIKAISDFLKEHPDCIFVLAGDISNIPQELNEILNEIKSDQVRLVRRVFDMPAFYKCLTAFVHTPIDSSVESFGLVYAEAFAAGTPSIITLSGVANEIAKNRQNCLVVDYQNDAQIKVALEFLYVNQDIRSQLAISASKAVEDLSIQEMVSKYKVLVS